MRTTTPADEARAAVAAYAEPDFSWSTLLQADLSGPREPGPVAAGLAALAARYPHLGPPPRVCLVPAVADL
ncbi:MAG TPA: hypothetical protein VJT31_34520, partial [Rugosimonospora sp.]|nr:hypothetical protein [Rugosimonospora sp.]